MFDVKNVFVSGLVYNTRVDVSLLERVYILGGNFIVYLYNIFLETHTYHPLKNF